MGGPGPRQFVAPAALPGAALQPASFSIEDLEERIDDATEAGRKSILLLVRRGGDPRFVALGIAD